MQLNSLQTFLNRKGQVVNVSWLRPMKTLKTAVGVTVQKGVTTNARAGVDYDNMRDVIQGRADGTLPAENAGLPWGKWAHVGGVDLFPHVIAHTPKGATQEKHYLRFAKLPGAVAKVSYFINGLPATADEARKLTLASEWSESEGAVFNVTADSITDIH